VFFISHHSSRKKTIYTLYYKKHAAKYAFSSNNYLFQNPTEMGTSPECTFNIDSRAGGNFKTISTTNLLFNDNVSTHSMNLEHQMPSLASQPDARRIEDTPNSNKNDENSLSCTDCSSSARKLNKQQQQKQNSQLHQNNLDLSAINATQRSDAIKNIRNSGYLIAVHRKLNRQDTYFLSHHKSRPCLFGVPILIPCYDGTTNKDLYCSVWVQVARLLSPLPPTPPDQANHATDW
jgi:ubiquitin carboxyl-terminal hydrolase 6/32